MSEKRSETSVSGKSFVRGRTIEEEERHGRPQAARIVRRITAERRALPGSRGSGSFARVLFGRHPLKPAPQGAPDKVAARRVTVKMNYAPARKQGQWAAHGSYLEREGAQKEDERGQGFDAKNEEVSLVSRLNEWQMAGDPRLFKVILAPEDGDRLAVREYTREYMARLAPHLSEHPERIEWAAIEHYNTGHPHVHLLIRGNHGLRISPDLVRTGMRDLASGLATERLGYRSPAEVRHAREKQVDARKLTSLDREIERMAKPMVEGKSFLAEKVLSPRDRGYADQRLRMQRLEALERLGLAEKMGSSTWVLDAGWTKGLRELEVLQTRSKMVAQSRALMTDPRCQPQVTKIKPGERLVGRVLGTGLDEQNDRSYLLIEGTDYRAHIVYQTAAIEKARAAQGLQPRHLVAIEGKAFEQASRGGQPVKTISYVSVEDYGLVISDKPAPVKMPEKALDDALDAGMQPAAQANTGFQRFWHEQLLERQRQRALEKQKEERKRQEEERQARERASDTSKTLGPPSGRPAPGRDDVDME
ncbi:DUF3363 domain-containing protein [Acidithiobacillus sp. VAN18-1]|uniref:DUF3363 domain-containing protein n=1 Tax=Igneacidithiobacillus copahuensis TaxID=2724909 RepID=A0AAE3CK38_9PROT|nr:DUF3363 domain-containing protein [Igneacidithiobacillus copahuensis]MBU2796925.1 DUF3363 domain-containing protein [Acidithiobacillus sp. VAN18-2]